MWLRQKLKEIYRILFRKEPKKSSRSGPRKYPLSEDWLNLWSFGRYCLGLGEKEFWRLTLAQFNELANRYNDRQERDDYHFAMVCAVIANAFRGKRKRPFKPDDFMPKRKTKLPTEEQLKQKMIAITMALGGEVKNG